MLLRGQRGELGPGPRSLPAAGPWASSSTDTTTHLVHPKTCCLALLEEAGCVREKLQPLSQPGTFSLPAPRRAHGQQREQGETGLFPFPAGIFPLSCCHLNTLCCHWHRKELPAAPALPSPLLAEAPSPHPAPRLLPPAAQQRGEISSPGLWPSPTAGEGKWTIWTGHASHPCPTPP